MYQQLVNADPSITYVGGLCLAAVQDSFHVKHIYPTASAEWAAQPTKHTDRPPSGIDCPVYFTLQGEPAGHVASQLKNGTVASSSLSGTHKGLYIHANIDALLKFYSAVWVIKYIGWGEYSGLTQVVKQINQGEDMVDVNFLNAFYIDLCNRSATDAEKKLYIGRGFAEVYNEIRSGDEHKNLIASIANQKQTISGLESERDTINYPKISAATAALDIPSSASPSDITTAIKQLSANNANATSNATQLKPGVYKV